MMFDVNRGLLWLKRRFPRRWMAGVLEPVKSPCAGGQRKLLSSSRDYSAPVRAAMSRVKKSGSCAVMASKASGSSRMLVSCFGETI